MLVSLPAESIKNLTAVEGNAAVSKVKNVSRTTSKGRVEA